MSTDLRISFIVNRDKFTPEMKARRIHKLDVIEAALQFSIPLAVQLQRDQFAGYKCWDSFSMILQSESLLPSEVEVARFKDWAMKQLQKQWLSK